MRPPGAKKKNILRVQLVQSRCVVPLHVRQSVWHDWHTPATGVNPGRQVAVQVPRDS